MKIRIVKTECYNPYNNENFDSYKIQFLRKRFLFWKYWYEPKNLNEYGFNESNIYNKLESVNEIAERIIRACSSFTETVVKEFNSEI